MAELKKRYKSIDDTLSHIRLQVKESLPYAESLVPDMEPEELYYWLKDHTVYKNDPEGVELLQAMPTLFEGEYWGIPGAGDCDCFTIATLAALSVQSKQYPTWIKLVGRDKISPVHIYAGIDRGNQEVPLDLTNKRPGQERDYKYEQKIYFSPVVANLSESYYSCLVDPLTGMYLQLADNSPFLLSAPAENVNPYVFVPNFNTGGGTYVREDYFDDMPEQEYHQWMTFLAPYQTGRTVMHDSYLSGAIRNWLDRRRERKQQKQESKQKRREANTAIKMARAGAIQTGGTPFQNIANAIGNVASGIFGGGGSAPDGSALPLPPPPAPGSSPTNMPFLDQVNFLGMTNKQTLLYGGAGYLLYRFLK